MTIEFTQETANYICEQLSIGRSLISISKDTNVPSYATIYRWRKNNKDFDTSIAHAREIQADYFLDKQIEIADNATVEDYLLRKFQADNLKWVASKLQPKKYGDKVTLGGDSDNPVALNLNVTFGKKDV